MSEESVPFLEQLPTAQCNVCGAIGGFNAGGASSNMRESLVCDGCGSISRDRCLVLVLGALLGRPGPMSTWAPASDVRIFETAAYRAHPRYLAGLFDYFPTIFDRAALAADVIDGRRHADLEALPYPDRFFDVVLSADVLEHVRCHLVALAEVHRVLRPGGLFVLEVPYVHAWPETQVRVHAHGKADVVLYPPQYHDEDTLVYRIFGRELLSELSAIGFSVAYASIERGRVAVSRQDVILCAKDGFLDLSLLVEDCDPSDGGAAAP